MIDTRQLGAKIFEYIDTLAELSEHPDHLTRCSLTREHKQANALVEKWMQSAGMSTYTDAIGNIVGRYAAQSAAQSETEPSDSFGTSPALLLGSHLDTVRNGGRYDGMLGVVAPLVCIAALHGQGIRLPFAVEIVGFCDEEGVRFPSTLFGSRAIAGTLDPATLGQQDENGISIADALRDFGLDPNNLKSAQRAASDYLGFVEVHIEQGPVLETQNIPVGVVTAISGAARYQVSVQGVAGHAGTVPMSLRQDALTGAAECMLAIEAVSSDYEGLVATVGQIKALPGATNVIPGTVEFSIDIRSSEDAIRQRAEDRITDLFAKISSKRKLDIQAVKTYEAGSVDCDKRLTRQLAKAIESFGYPVQSLPSGAGHDAMALAELTPIAMLFVRCKGGISHHPDESITVQDANAVADVLLRFLQDFNPATLTAA